VGLFTAAGTAGGSGTLICVFIEVKAMADGDAVLVLMFTPKHAPPRSRLPL
jgi:hypothetical protein